MSQINEEKVMTDEEHGQFETQMFDIVNRHSIEADKKRKATYIAKQITKLDKKVENNLFWVCMGKVLFFMMVCFILWVGVSFINVVLNNSSPETTHLIWDLNFFKMFF